MSSFVTFLHKGAAIGTLGYHTLPYIIILEQ